MENVEYKLDAKSGILTIKVDMSKELGPSASGKTILIGSTRGAVKVDGTEDVKLNLSVYKPNK